MTQRQYAIFYQLLNMHPCSIQDLCILFNITVPTLKSEIEKMNEILNEYDVYIYLDAQYAFFHDYYLAQYYFKSIETKVEMSLEAKAMLVLLLTPSAITLQDIADILYISKSKMHQVAKKMQEVYKPHFESSRTNGYIASQSVEEKRQLLVNLLLPYFIGVNMYDEFIDFSNRQFELLNYIDEINLKKIYKFYQIMKLQPEMYINDSDFQKMFLYMCSCEMISQTLSFEQIYVENEFYNNVIELTDMVFSEDVEISTKIYINNILARQITNGKHLINHEELMCIENIIRSIDEDLYTDFLSYQMCNDIYKFLYYHRDTYTSNIDTQLSVELVEVKHKYPLAFEAAVRTTSCLQEVSDLELTELDRIYLALYYQKVLNNQRESIDVVIVTPHEKVIGEVVKQELQREFSEIVSVEIISLFEYTTQQIVSDNALILSMVPFSSQVHKVIPITPVLKKHQLEEIRKYIRNKQSMGFVQTLLKDSLLIKSKKDFDSKFEIISHVVEELEKQNRVTKQYLKTVHDREKVSSTALSGISVPHGDTQEVIKDTFCMIQLKEPFIWDHHKVEFIIMIALTKESIKKHGSVYNNMYRTIAKSNFFITLYKNKELENKALQDQLIELFLEK